MVDDEETRDRLGASVQEMQGMLDTTLSFARGVDTTEQSRRVAVGDTLRSLGKDMVPLFTLEDGPEAHIVVRPIGFRRALRNLIENAIRYGGGARVSFAVRGADVVISIDDDGPGIPEDALEEVFLPFHRLEASRSLETGGHGLGLSIARGIIRAHGGDVVLSNRAGGGLRACVTLPEANGGAAWMSEADDATGATGAALTHGRDGTGRDGAGPNAETYARKPVAPNP